MMFPPPPPAQPPGLLSPENHSLHSQFRRASAGDAYETTFLLKAQSQQQHLEDGLNGEISKKKDHSLPVPGHEQNLAMDNLQKELSKLTPSNDHNETSGNADRQVRAQLRPFVDRMASDPAIARLASQRLPDVEAVGASASTNDDASEARLRELAGKLGDLPSHNSTYPSTPRSNVSSRNNHRTHHTYPPAADEAATTASPGVIRPIPVSVSAKSSQTVPSVDVTEPDNQLSPPALPSRLSAPISTSSGSPDSGLSLHPSHSPASFQAAYPPPLGSHPFGSITGDGAQAQRQPYNPARGPAEAVFPPPNANLNLDPHGYPMTFDYTDPRQSRPTSSSLSAFSSSASPPISPQMGSPYPLPDNRVAGAGMWMVPPGPTVTDAGNNVWIQIPRDSLYPHASDRLPASYPNVTSSQPQFDQYPSPAPSTFQPYLHTADSTFAHSRLPPHAPRPGQAPFSNFAPSWQPQLNQMAPYPYGPASPNVGFPQWQNMSYMMQQQQPHYQGERDPGFHYNNGGFSRRFSPNHPQRPLWNHGANARDHRRSIPPDQQVHQPIRPFGDLEAGEQGHSIERKDYHPAAPANRSEWVMWVGNVPGNITHEELWKFFNAPIDPSQMPPGLPFRPFIGVASIFLISRSSCAFVNLKTAEDLELAIPYFNGKVLRPWDPRCPKLVCRVRRKEDDLKAGVGLQRGSGMHIRYIKALTAKEDGDSQPEDEDESSPEPKSSPKVDQDEAEVTATSLPDSDSALPELSESGLPAGISPAAFAAWQRDQSTSGTHSFASTNTSFLIRNFPQRYFILKSSTVEDLEASKQTGLWSTQPHNEAILDQAFRTSPEVFLIFGANKQGCFAGYALMRGAIREQPGGHRRSVSSSESRRGSSPNLSSGLAGASQKYEPPLCSNIPEESPVELSEEPMDSHLSARFAISSPSQLTPSEMPETVEPLTALGTNAIEQGLDSDALTHSGGQPNLPDPITDGGTDPHAIKEDPGPLVRAASPERAEERADHDKSPEKHFFKVQWIKTTAMPFHRIRHLRNPWNQDKEVKVSRDGTELSPDVGQKLIDEWETMDVAAVV